jgi:hypothetical protein
MGELIRLGKETLSKGCFHKEDKVGGECNTAESGAINMVKSGSKKRDLHVQVLKAMLQTRGSKVMSLQLI